MYKKVAMCACELRPSKKQIARGCEGLLGCKVAGAANQKGCKSCFAWNRLRFHSFKTRWYFKLGRISSSTRDCHKSSADR